MQKRSLILTLTYVCSIFLFGACSKQTKPESSLNQITQPATQNTQTKDTAQSDEQMVDETVTPDITDTLTDLQSVAEKTQPAASDGKVINITEKMYVTWINEIYTNATDYVGQTVTLEGMYSTYTEESTDTVYHYVYRVGPGCCGNDGSMCGFEFTYDGEMPKENDWIKLTGVVDVYEEDGYKYLALRAAEIEVKSERGQETVFQ